MFAKYVAKYELSGAQWPQATLASSLLEGARPSIVVVFGFPRTEARALCAPGARATFARNSNILGPRISRPRGLQGLRAYEYSVSFGVFALGVVGLAFETRLVDVTTFSCRRKRSSL